MKKLLSVIIITVRRPMKQAEKPDMSLLITFCLKYDSRRPVSPVNVDGMGY